MLGRHERMIEIENPSVELAVGHIGGLAGDVRGEASRLRLVTDGERLLHGACAALQGGASPSSKSASIEVRRVSSPSLRTPTTLPKYIWKHSLRGWLPKI